MSTPHATEIAIVAVSWLYTSHSAGTLHKLRAMSVEPLRCNSVNGFRTITGGGGMIVRQGGVAIT